jgi:methionyl-tRNA synthetase
LFKAGKQNEVEQILYSVLESIRLSAYLLSPIVPNLSIDIYQQLGFSGEFNNKTFVKEADLWDKHSQWGHLKANQNLDKAKPIFLRLELPSNDQS